MEEGEDELMGRKWQLEQWWQILSKTSFVFEKITNKCSRSEAERRRPPNSARE